MCATREDVNHETKENIVSPEATMTPPAAAQAEDDGLAPDPGNTRLPDPDDGLSRPNYGDGGADDAEGGAQQPPTPPADLPEDGDDEEEKDPLLFLLGHKQLGVKVGGFKPDSNVLKIKGGKIDLEGQFDLGERFPAVFDLQVTGNLQRHGIELETGTIKSQTQSQEATVCGTTTLPVYLERKLGADHPELLADVLRALGVEEG